MEENRNPDLQRILAGLKGIVPDASTASSSHSAPAHTSIPGIPLPNASAQHSYTTAAKVPPRPIPTAPAPIESSDPPKLTAQLPDPSTITTWPAALKYVTKHIVTNEITSTRIRHLIAQQAKHEREWWAGRESLVERQLGRAGKQQEVATLLKSIGGLAAPIVVESDPVTNQKELEAYDLKVYTGLTKMGADFDRQLRGLGVPFFAIKHALVTLERNGAETGGAKIDRGKLGELQKKMLQTLEDLLVD